MPLLKNLKTLVNLFTLCIESEIFMKNADALQSVFDRKKLSSGVHLVIKK